MNKAVVFDLDGTLLDTIPDIADNVNLALEKFGYKKREYSEIRAFIGNGAKMLVKRCLGEDVAEETVQACLEYYNQIYTASKSPKTALFDGIEDVLVKLKQKGYKLAILTNKPQPTTDEVYKTYLERFNFDLVVGQSPLVKCKPDKEAVLNILKQLNVQPENAYMVGDGETDVLTAVNAKMKCITVLWGYRDKDFLATFGADTFANSPSEILDFILV